MYEIQVAGSYNFSEYNYTILGQSDVMNEANLNSPKSANEVEMFQVKLPDSGKSSSWSRFGNRPNTIHITDRRSSAPVQSWKRHQMETFSALLTICVGNSPVTGQFPSQRPVTRSFDVFFDPRLNERPSKQSWGWWFEMPSHSLWRHCDGIFMSIYWHQSFHQIQVITILLKIRCQQISLFSF